jgi:phosphatidylglycerol:prolipoprotein diacylglycerol transferase
MPLLAHVDPTLTTSYAAFTLADAWVHDLDPVITPIFGAFALRWYGLAYLLGFAVAYLILRLLAARGAIALAPQRVLDAMLLLVLGVVIGGRVGYALFYNPDLLIGFEPSAPWWDLLAFHKGGMASHGGILGVALAALWIAKREGLRFLALTDALALATPPGLLFGRLANFINGELLGRIVADPGEPAPSWAVRFPQELTERPAELDARLSAAQRMQLEQLITQQAVAIEQHAQAAGREIPAQTDLFSIALAQLIDRVQHGNEQLAQRLGELLTARHPSQLYQAAMEGLVVFLVLAIIWIKPRPAGTLSAAFLITYGVGRIATEVFRLPDVGVPVYLGLSRGQWLSAAMIFGGGVLLAIVRSKQFPKAGGWLITTRATTPTIDTDARGEANASTDTNPTGNADQANDANDAAR